MVGPSAVLVVLCTTVLYYTALTSTAGTVLVHPVDTSTPISLLHAVLKVH